MTTTEQGLSVERLRRLRFLTKQTMLAELERDDLMNTIIEVVPELFAHIDQQADRLSRYEAALETQACQMRILDQAINWTTVEMDRDCQEGSIGAFWRDRLRDAQSRAAALSTTTSSAAPAEGAVGERR